MKKGVFVGCGIIISWSINKRQGSLLVKESETAQVSPKDKIMNVNKQSYVKIPGKQT